MTPPKSMSHFFDLVPDRSLLIFRCLKVLLELLHFRVDNQLSLVKVVPSLYGIFQLLLVLFLLSRKLLLQLVFLFFKLRLSLLE